MKITTLKQLKTKMPWTTICYARTGQRLYDGPTSQIPEQLKQYYVFQKIVNRVKNKIYVEIVEDKAWFE